MRLPMCVPWMPRVADALVETWLPAPHPPRSKTQEKACLVHIDVSEALRLESAAIYGCCSAFCKRS
jgi:hypothetical protein